MRSQQETLSFVETSQQFPLKTLKMMPSEQRLMKAQGSLVRLDKRKTEFDIDAGFRTSE